MMIQSNFKFSRLLGSGSSGEVWEAIYIKTNKKYAIKIIKRLPKSLIDSFTSIKNRGLTNFESNEINHLSRTHDHPNIVRLYDVIVSSSHIFMIQELIEGGDLFEFILSESQKNKLKKNNIITISELHAKVLFIDLISAVHYIHSKHIAHRDIKPENCLISIDGHLILTDFGLSTSNSFSKQICGTPEYIAPEILNGNINENGYDPFIADIWSCGVVLSFMLTGRLPYKRNFRSKPIKTEFFENNYSKTIISSSCLDLLQKMLDPNPNTRANLDQVLSHSFFN